MKIRRFTQSLSLVFFLMGCSEWKMDASDLTARGTAIAPGPSCSSCHAYPLLDTNHTFHLFKAESSKFINGTITCLDCHSTAMRFKEVDFIDSIYSQPDGSRYSTLDYPVGKSSPNFGDTVRTFQLDTIMTLTQHRPFLVPDRPGPGSGSSSNPSSNHSPKLAEYMTGLAHLNRHVDVVFDQNVSDTLKFKGQKAAFNPTQETCSAVACHPGQLPYRWGAPFKGLDTLRGE